MTDNDRLMRQAEGQGALRRVLLIINAISYIVWIGSIGLGHMGDLSIDAGTLAGVRAIAWPIWLVSLIGVIGGMIYLRRRRDVAGLVDDERTVGLSAASFRMGYWVLLIAVAAVYTASFFGTVDVKLVAPLLLALGVAAPSLTYAVLYRA